MPVKVDHDRYALEAGLYAPAAADSFSPISTAGQHLVEALQRIGWDHPDFDVEIYSKIEDDNVCRGVARISGMTANGPFRLSFTHGREAILREASVPPGIEVVYYEDRSGPSVDLYVGSDWIGEGRGWTDAIHTNARLNDEPKTYLSYSGCARNPLGVIPAVKDHREHAPEGDEPRTLEGAAVARQVSDFIEGLASRLNALPAADGHDDAHLSGDANFRRLTAVDKIPAPADFPELFIGLRDRDCHRIFKHGETGNDDIFLVPGTGHRLCPRTPDELRGTDRGRQLWNGFSYASEQRTQGHGHPFEINHGEITYPVRIKLETLNDVLVFDAAAYDVERWNAFATAKEQGRDRLTDAEVDRALGVMAMTAVPAAEYTGGFSEPVYAIGRRLGPLEARAVVGKISVARDGEHVAAIITDSDGKAHDLYRADGSSRYHVAEAVKNVRLAEERYGRRAHVPEDIIEIFDDMQSRRRKAFEQMMEPAAAGPAT